MSGFPDARSVVHLICKDRKELLSSCNRKSPLLYWFWIGGGRGNFMDLAHLVYTVVFYRHDSRRSEATVRWDCGKINNRVEEPAL